MNLFCFTLDGSTDNIYEPPYHNQCIRGVLPGSSYSPAVLRRTPDWGGSDPCISSIHLSPAKQKIQNRRSHNPHSALEHKDSGEGDDNTVELVSGGADRDLPTQLQSAERDLRTAEPHRKQRRFHRLLLVKKASQREAGRGKNESKDLKKTAASSADSPLMSCMGLVRRSGRHSTPLPGQRPPSQGKHKKGRVGDEEERREQEEDEGDGGGRLQKRGGPPCHYWSPGDPPQTGTAASVHTTTQHRVPPEPWDYVFHGALVSRIAQWDPSEGVPGVQKSQRAAKGSSPSPAPPSLRDEEDAAESPSGERRARSQDQVSRVHVSPGGQQRRSSNLSESLDSLNSGQSSSSGVTSGSICSSNRNSLRTEEDLLHPARFCARARVHTDFVPSPYDMESLRLKVGDVIDVIAKPTMGIWRGMLNGNTGSFKFVYVDILEDRGSEKCLSHRPGSKPRPDSLEELLKQHSLGECSSILRLHGHQEVEDLARLRDRHPASLNEICPDNRRRLLAAAESLQEPQRGRERHQGSETPSERSMVDVESRPRDSGCHMPSDCSDNGRDDSEINFLNISSPTLDQISAV
ncbi:SAM domain-containing protein SAMSN-1b isoform X2 [Gadus macrocephalus]|uniref:SAM domain-containing protein SAMSN-1b isoform X2 n=1 Tax=Gadus macrocephalus TaxID=80720 RepID=UPI0028CB3AB4|nr:SAM domain-containing protein SAMSN-1b isoform X2 [Gadus macrocephalus]